MAFLVEGLTSSRDVENQVRRIGEYSLLDEALDAARSTIDQFLQREVKPGMTPASLFARYQSFGEVPIIFRDDDDHTMNVSYFNHFEYALRRCAEIAIEIGGNFG